MKTQDHAVLASVYAGVDSRWLIALAEGAQSAERIAAQELQQFFRSLGCELKIVSQAEVAGAASLWLAVEGGTQQDRFRLSGGAGRITVTGSNSRSVLFGVYRLIDWIRGDRSSDELCIEECAHFLERWMPPTIHGRSDDTRNFSYLARLGANTSYLRGRRDAFTEVKHFTHYFRDEQHLPQISQACPPDDKLRGVAQSASRQAQAHGLEVVMFEDEPIAIAGPQSKNVEVKDALPAALLTQLPPDAIGTAHCLRYRNDGWKALSVFHPKVEAHYRQLLRQALAQFPGLRTLYLYNEDGGSANVWPPSEPCAKDAYPAGYDDYPYAAHLRLAEILQDEGRTQRSDFRVATVTFHWYQPDALRRKMVAGLPRNSVLITLAAWDDSVDSTRLPAWTKDLIAQAHARKDLVLLADDDFNGTSDDLLMEMTAGFPMPHRTYRKCAAWAEAGVAGVTQHHTGGPTLGVNSITDLAWREFTWRPRMTSAEAECTILRLLSKQLNNLAAAQAMLQACRAVDRALDAIEADVDQRPYASRLGHSLGIVFPPHLDQGLIRTGASTGEYCGDGIDPQRWRVMLRRETDEYAQALAHAQAARALAPENESPFHLLCRPSTPMSCREYADVAANAIEIVLCFKRAMLNFIEVEYAADEAAAKLVWANERQNMQQLLSALTLRQRWMQSPYGAEILRRHSGWCQHKLQVLQRHLQ